MERTKLAFLAALTLIVVFSFVAINPASALGQCGEKNCGYFRTTCPQDYKCVENRFVGGWCIKDIGCSANKTAVCGNGKCEVGETYLTCSDCPKPLNYYNGTTAASKPFCGNGKCDPGESYVTCSDCPKPVSYYYYTVRPGRSICGNKICETGRGGENYRNCPKDCPAPRKSR